jgi:hypothetical protein
MAWKRWMIAATGACAFTMMLGGAQSAPLGSSAADFRSPAAAGTGFERVEYRRAYRYPRRAYGYRVDGYRPRVSPYAVSRVYAYGAAPALGYVAPPVFAYSAAPVSGDVAPPAYVNSFAPPVLAPPVLAPPVVAAPVYGYAAAPVYGYAAAPPAVYGAGPPIVRRLIPAIEYANPYVYPVGTPAWWSVMNRENRGGQAQ